MLVLTRKQGQSIVIGEEIYLTILGLKGNQVSLGFKAPQNLPIHREEIHNRILIKNKNQNKFDEQYYWLI